MPTHVIYSKGDKIKCPHPECGEEQEGVVEDFVVPGRVGGESMSEEQCGHCDEYFTVMLGKDGKYVVDVIEPEENE